MPGDMFQENLSGQLALLLRDLAPMVVLTGTGINDLTLNVSNGPLHL